MPEPTARPTVQPHSAPMPEPTARPTVQPHSAPTPEPTARPTATPTPEPTAKPTDQPAVQPTQEPDDNNGGDDDDTPTCHFGQANCDDANDDEGNDGDDDNSGNDGGCPGRQVLRGGECVSRPDPKTSGGECPAGQYAPPLPLIYFVYTSTTPEVMTHAELNEYVKSGKESTSNLGSWQKVRAGHDCYTPVEDAGGTTIGTSLASAVKIALDAGKTAADAVVDAYRTHNRAVYNTVCGKGGFISAAVGAGSTVSAAVLQGAAAHVTAAKAVVLAAGAKAAVIVGLTVAAIWTACTIRDHIEGDDNSDNSDDDSSGSDSSGDDDSSGSDSSGDDDSSGSDNSGDDDSSGSDNNGDDDSSGSDNNGDDNSGDGNGDDSTDTNIDPTVNGDVSNRQLQDAFDNGYWFSYENGPGCSFIGAGRSTDRTVYKCPDG